jgi:hypothetical protein
MRCHSIRIGRLSLWWFSGRADAVAKRLRPTIVRWSPFHPAAWRWFWWRFAIQWLVPDWDRPRQMSRQERRQVERKLRAGKSVVFSNTPGRKR